MSTYLEPKSHPSERQQAASLLRSLEWGGFWIQLILSIISGLILGFLFFCDDPPHRLLMITKHKDK
ncbi:DUF3611 family protein [Anabaena sp. UHCC 0187]|uniref:DUF3611 family protein n=1 Tax=Anabaena sp. UHCC 0187 TaxID=2590018 RepID=UPI00352BAE43